VFALTMGFVMADGEGTQLPGVFKALIRVRSEDTNGVMAVVEETMPPRSLIPPHTHDSDVWVYVLSGLVGVLVGEEIGMASAGSWALKPRSVVHAMWNPESESARIIEVLTPAGTERWFEEVTQLVDGDDDGFRDACERYGIRFLTESPWTDVIRERFGVE
jgi:quercetin dioxygenase-like cupin family protein